MSVAGDDHTHRAIVVGLWTHGQLRLKIWTVSCHLLVNGRTSLAHACLEVAVEWMPM